MAPADWEELIRTDLMSAFATTRAAIMSGMMRARWGRIVNISSVAGRTARAGNGVYAATKWGLNGWSESLRQELLPGIRVTLIEPGVVATELDLDPNFARAPRAAPDSRVTHDSGTRQSSC